MSYHILTSSSRTLAILDAVGYRVMGRERFFWEARAEISVESDTQRIRNRVNDNQRKLLDDHVDLPVRAYLLDSASATSFALFSVVRKDDEQQYFDLLHLDGVGTFADNAQASANLIATEPRAILASDC